MYGFYIGPDEKFLLDSCKEIGDFPTFYELISSGIAQRNKRKVGDYFG